MNFGGCSSERRDALKRLTILIPQKQIQCNYKNEQKKVKKGGMRVKGRTVRGSTLNPIGGFRNRSRGGRILSQQRPVRGIVWVFGRGIGRGCSDRDGIIKGHHWRKKAGVAAMILEANTSKRRKKKSTKRL